MTAMPDIRHLQEKQLDALREVANIGAGNAATALSKMIGTMVMISVPRITVSRLAAMPPMVSAPEEPVVAVVLHMMGDVAGRTLLVFPRRAAARLAELMLNRPTSVEGELSALEQSAIVEAGNILSSTYLNALSALLGMLLMPSPPTMSVEVSTAVLTTENLKLGAMQDEVLCVENEFLMKESDEKLRGFFLLLPDSSSLNAILRAMKAA
jgi:chemotaxis protein CheC